MRTDERDLSDLSMFEDTAFPDVPSYRDGALRDDPFRDGWFRDGGSGDAGCRDAGFGDVDRGDGFGAAGRGDGGFRDGAFWDSGFRDTAGRAEQSVCVAHWVATGGRSSLVPAFVAPPVTGATGVAGNRPEHATRRRRRDRTF